MRLEQNYCNYCLFTQCLYPVQFYKEMLRSGESETEILLGNKQLLGIFFVVAVLLGVAFAGGYMVGKGPGKKPAAVVSASDETASAPAANTGGETHSVGADSSADAQTDAAPPKSAQAAPPAVPTPASEEPPLGSPNRKTFKQHEASTESEPPAAPAANSFAPGIGQTFLQVAAVGRDEAEAIADVLHKKGFRAHAVPKPGNPKLFRVLIGPIRDAGDLSTTRDSLRKTGFREVIVQHY